MILPGSCLANFFNLYLSPAQFIDRIIALRRAVFDPHMLKNLICVSTWQTSGSRSGQWKLYIKFRKRNKLASSANAVLWDRIKPKVNSLEDQSEGEASWESMEDDDLASSEAALLKELDDIYHNPESDCSILHVQVHYNSS